MGDVENFEQDMATLENWGADPSNDPTPQGGQENKEANPGQVTPAQVQEFWRKAGGREWKDPNELGKAYDGLLRLQGKKDNEYNQYRKQMEQWDAFGKYLKQHPELQKSFVDKAKEYHERLKAGQSPSTAKNEMQVPQQVAEKLERFETYLEDVEFEKEVNAVKGKYKLDDAQVRMVLERAKALNGVSLELAYKDIAFESGFQTAKQQGIEEAKKQQAAGGGAASAPSVTPAPKGSFSHGIDKNWRDSAGKALEQFGIR